MIPFDYQRAHDAADAVATVSNQADAAFLGGGTNLVDHLKLGLTQPGLLVDVSGLPLDTVTERPGALRIGASVRNSDLAADPIVRARHPLLSRALLAGASPQLRNVATTAGNLMQRTRCPYFQDVTTACNKREPGSGCSALSGHVRDHAVLGASDQCIAVHPSDMAVALVALDAVVVVLTPEGERTVPMPEFHRLPGDEPHRDTVLGHGELITAVDVPDPPAARRSAYRKVRDRASFAFALVSVAVTVELDSDDETVRDVRIVLGGVAHKPWRALRAEEVVRGSRADVATFGAAAEAELAEARPMPGNEFKVPLARHVMVSSLRELTTDAGGE